MGVIAFAASCLMSDSGSLSTVSYTLSGAGTASDDDTNAGRCRSKEQVATCVCFKGEMQGNCFQQACSFNRFEQKASQEGSQKAMVAGGGGGGGFLAEPLQLGRGSQAYDCNA